MRLTELRIMTKMSENDNVLHFMVISFSFLTLMALLFVVLTSGRYSRGCIGCM